MTDWLIVSTHPNARTIDNESHLSHKGDSDVIQSHPLTEQVSANTRGQEQTRVVARLRVCSSVKFETGRNLLPVLKMEQPVTCLATAAYVYAACAVRVTIF